MSGDGAWTRLSPWSMFTFALAGLRGGWQLLLVWLFGGSSLGGRLELDGALLLLLLVAGAALLLVAFASWNWWFFQWRCDEQAIELRRGLLFRSQLRLPFERIQRVDVLCPPWYRLLGRGNLVLESAGSAESEVTLPALREDQAQALRERIRSQRTEDTPTAAASGPPAARPERELHALHTPDLIAIGVSSPTALVLFPVLGGLYAQLPQPLHGRVEELIEAAVRALPGASLALTVLSGAVVLLMLLALSLVVSVAVTTLRWHGYGLVRSGNLLRQRAGLLSLREQDLNRAKVQQVVYRRNPLQRLLGIGQLRLSQATTLDDEQAAFIVPGLSPYLARRVLRELYPQLASEAPPWQPISPLWQLWFLRLGFVLPGLGLALTLWLTGLSAWLLLTLLPWAALLGWLGTRRYRLWGWRLEGPLLCVRSGLFGSREISIELDRVQRIDLLQSPFQRRRALASLRLWTPSGALWLPFLPLSTARDLARLAQQRMFASRVAWM